MVLLCQSENRRDIGCGIPFCMAGQRQVSTVVLAGGKQVISDYQTENNDNDGQKTICDKEHDGHTDAKPEQNKTNQSLHMTSLLSHDVNN